MRNHRLDWLLILSALGVVAIHTPVYCAMTPFAKEFFAQGCCGVAVYLFFIASGFFLAKHVGERFWWVCAMRTRIRTLLVPYVFWCSLYAVVQIMLKVGDLGLVRVFGLDITTMPLYYPFWFIRNLLLLVLFSPVLAIIAENRGGGGVVLIVLAVLSLIVSVDAHILPGGILINSFFYFMIGMFIGIKRVKVSLPIWGCLLLGGLGLALFALQAANRAFLSSNVIRYLPIGGLAGWALMVGLWGLMPMVPLPKILVGVTFPVYALHVFLLMTVAPFIANSGLALIVAFIASVGLGHMIKRLFPRIAMIIFGGR